jgi:hypothetical protein
MELHFKNHIRTFFLFVLYLLELIFDDKMAAVGAFHVIITTGVTDLSAFPALQDIHGKTFKDASMNHPGAWPSGPTGTGTGVCPPRSIILQ